MLSELTTAASRPKGTPGTHIFRQLGPCQLCEPAQLTAVIPSTSVQEDREIHAPSCLRGQ